MSNVLDEIVEVAGEDVAMKVHWHFPGVKVFFAANPDPDGLVAQAIGLEAASVLGRYFGCGVTIPTGEKAARMTMSAEKNKTIMDMYAAGEKVRDIALHVGVTERRIYQVIAKARGRIDGRQLDMFASPENDNADNDNG